ncbi:MAG: response regulator transcription factor [Burkholderiales bacterium]|nr:response regulator transcription factor [Burkholderiales bacterium]
MTEPAGGNPAEKPTLLVIDDDDAVVIGIRARLGKYFNVAGTTNPLVALETVLRERPHVILCDINMPGMKGDQVAQVLAEDPVAGAIPFIYLTGLLAASQTSELDGLFGGYVAVSKSASTPDLMEVIRAAMG